MGWTQMIFVLLRTALRSQAELAAENLALRQQLKAPYGKGLSTAEQQYDTMAMVNDVRRRVDLWRRISTPNDWQVTPETARLLQHWRHHRFSSFRPFFCQIEAVETVIWLPLHFDVR